MTWWIFFTSQKMVILQRLIHLEGMEDFQMKIGQMNLGKIFHKVIWPGPPNGRVVLFDSVQKEIPKSNHVLDVCIKTLYPWRMGRFQLPGQPGPLNQLVRKLHPGFLVGTGSNRMAEPCRGFSRLFWIIMSCSAKSWKPRSLQWM